MNCAGCSAQSAPTETPYRRLRSPGCGDPDVLILDEPMNGLDPLGIGWTRDLLRAQARRGRAVLVSRHLLSEVAQSVDNIVVIAEGQQSR